MVIMYSQKSLSTRIAEEAQLLAEEKWIIQAINQVRKQRNGLQIERLQLESMKALMKTETEKVSLASKTQLQTLKYMSEMSDAVNLMQSSSQKIYTELDTPSGWDKENCNEELNLSVSNPVLLTQTDTSDGDYPYEEEDDDEEDIYLDINMLMDANKD